MNIRKKIKALPTGPGVYLMKDAKGRVIYVGKAANIKKRASSYFTKSHLPYKNEALVKQVDNIEAIDTDSEHEAFLLESRLIKQLKPRYNISLRDDKTFPFIKITRHSFSRIFIGRKKPSENVEYLGPYTNSKSLRLALKSLRRVFPFCTCRKFPKKECLDFFLGLCSAPCTNRISQRDYKKNIRDLKHFLKKGSKSLIKDLQKRMRLFSKNKNFEEALKLREKIKALSILCEQTKPGSWQMLGLDRQPRRIEAFDVSNLFGDEAVGSMVTFLDSQPHKDGYRRFKIKAVKGIDDYKMLREVLSRRYSKVVREGLTRPELIIIDGGKGHLNIARQETISLGLDITIIAIAKEQELIYTVFKNRPINLDRDSVVLQLIQRVRDEAHRFAVKYHRLLRKKKALA
ncbi:GIY-YIG nuclease family protein [Candidatus Omnitrophota bacterium]